MQIKSINKLYNAQTLTLLMIPQTLHATQKDRNQIQNHFELGMHM